MVKGYTETCITSSGLSRLSVYIHVCAQSEGQQQEHELDGMDTANEMEALQALFEIGSRPASQELATVVQGTTQRTTLGISNMHPAKPFKASSASSLGISPKGAQCSHRLVDNIGTVNVLCEATGQVA